MAEEDKKTSFNEAVGKVILQKKYASIGTCPEKAIQIEVKANTLGTNLDEYTGVWVIMQIERITQQPKKVSYELLSEAGKLADKLHEKVLAVCLCRSDPDGMREILEQTGCDQLLLMENDLLQEYDTDLYTGIISSLILQHKPEIVLFPETEEGGDLAPCVAGRLRMFLTRLFQSLNHYSCFHKIFSL